MNILIFHWRDTKHEWSGGSEIYIREISERWVSLGHAVTLFCGQNLAGNLPSEEMQQGVRIIRKGGRFSVYIWAFYYFLREFRTWCDVIVDAQNGIPFFTPLYSRKPKTVIVHHMHGKQFFVELPFPFNIIGFCIERYLFPLFYKGVDIIAVSKSTKHELMKVGFLPDDIHVVYNGVTAHHSRGADNHKFITPTILYLGRIKKYKRVDHLIEIMPEIVKHVPTVRLLIAGWGTEASSVIDISMRGALRKKIKIIGPVSEKEKKYLLQKSWVFVNPSMNEGWGISIIEANSYGTPAVAYNVPGLSESIRDGKTGLLAHDKNEFTQQIIRLLKNNTLRAALGKEAIAWSHQFSWEKTANESLKRITSHAKDRSV
jgi:glycosyltransferase involved in cell wall biosynthesis